MAGNSWQQPVAGEPSWGSPHTHRETLVDAADPSGTGNTTVTCSNVPTGTTGVEGYYQFRSTSTAGRTMSIKDASANVWAQTRNAVVTIPAFMWFKVPLDANKQFLYNVDNADVDAVSIFLKNYYI